MVYLDKGCLVGRPAELLQSKISVKSGKQFKFADFRNSESSKKRFHYNLNFYHPHSSLKVITDSVYELMLSSPQRNAKQSGVAPSPGGLPVPCSSPSVHSPAKRPASMAAVISRRLDLLWKMSSYCSRAVYILSGEAVLRATAC